VAQAVVSARYGFGHEVSYGLDGLDLRLAAQITRHDGVFVEAGANDGLSQSNTALFERHRGWTGLLVEAIPDLARQCRVNRRGAVVEQAALVGPEHASETIFMHFAHLMSVVAGDWGGEGRDPAHVRDGLARQDLRDSYEVEVPARTLSSLLDAHGLDHVDLLCLGLEGYEVPALRGLDLSRHRPEFVLVEAFEPEGIAATLGPGYDLIDRPSPRDVLYRRRDSG